jgi:hypothetical protein
MPLSAACSCVQGAPVESAPCMNQLQRPPVFGWSAVETRLALTYAAVWVIALAARAHALAPLDPGPCVGRYASVNHPPCFLRWARTAGP